MDNSKKLKEIIYNCYQIYTQDFTKGFSNSDYSNVYKMLNIFSDIYKVNDVNIISQKYVNNDKLSYKQYNIEINTDFGNIYGNIKCCLENDKYNMILILSEKTYGLLSESVLNEALSIKQAAIDIRKAKSFQELRFIIKKYAKEGVLAGTLIAMILANFTLDQVEKYKISQEAYQLEEEYYDYKPIVVEPTEVESPKPKETKPEWKLLTNHTIVTVYNAVPAQCNADVCHTASGFELNLSNPEAHKVIAMERTMMKKFGLHYGDLVKIEGTGDRDGVYQIQDTMNKRFAGKNKIDILINNHSKLGKWDDIKIYKLLNPKETYDELKQNMLKAKNQSKMDKKYFASNNIHDVNESFSNLGLIYFEDNEEYLSFEKHKIDFNKIINKRKID